jgi:transposase-like protein
MADLTAPRFTDEDKAREHIETSRWPDGVNCPHCGSLNVMRMAGKTQAGYFLCRDCRGKFTCRTGTVMERSHIPLHKWLLAIHLMTSSKKGMSAHQLYRNLGFGSYRTAWFLEHRIREAMRPSDTSTPMGGEGKIVEADETYFGNIPESKMPKTKTTGRPFSKSAHKSGLGNKRAIVSLVERGGEVRSFHVPGAYLENVVKIVRENIAKETRLMTDESGLYKKVGREFASHETVNHSDKEYARGDVTTNTVEGFFSVFKRGMHGTYQHCSEGHLHRYLAEFDFRFNNRSKLGIEDTERAAIALKGAEGKRLTYRRTASL